MADWDAVVVGGGPAGSTTAALLAKGGHRVLLIDRAEFPRSKPCGESINPGAVQQLDELGLLSSVLNLPHQRIPGWRIQLGGAKGFEGSFPSGAHGIGMDRTLFDQALLDHASESGADIELGIRITDLERDGEQVVGVRTSAGGRIPAKLVIGADGLRSIVLRRLGLIRRRPRLRKLALTAHVTQAELDGSGRGELFLCPWGCLGIADVGSGISNVVIVLPADPFQLQGDTEAAFDRLMRAVPPLRSARRAGEIMSTGPFDWPTRGVVASGAMLVGDAAGYYDPFTGQGIFRALVGARLAASHASTALRAGDYSRPLLAYGREYRRAFRTGRLLQQVIEGVASRPSAIAQAARILRTFPGMADRVVARTGDLYTLAGTSRALRYSD